MRKITNQELGRLTPEQYACAGKMQVVVVLDNVRSAMNVGSFFRTADAFAVGEIVLCGITATPPSKEIHKTALGAEMTVRWRYQNDTMIAIEQLRSEGFTVVVIEQVQDATALNDFSVEEDKKYALVFGNEVDGVSQQVVDNAHGAIEIPQYGTKHSLNVSVAGAVVLWRFFEKTLAKLI